MSKKLKRFHRLPPTGDCATGRLPAQTRYSLAELTNKGKIFFVCLFFACRKSAS